MNVGIHYTLTVVALCLKKIYSFEQECLDYAQTANGQPIMFLWQEGNFEQTKEKRDERLFNTIN